MVEPTVKTWSGPPRDVYVEILKGLAAGKNRDVIARELGVTHEAVHVVAGSMVGEMALRSCPVSPHEPARFASV